MCERARVYFYLHEHLQKKKKKIPQASLKSFHLTFYDSNHKSFLERPATKIIVLEKLFDLCFHLKRRYCKYAQDVIIETTARE